MIEKKMKCRRFAMNSWSEYFSDIILLVVSKFLTGILDNIEPITEAYLVK